MPKFQDNESSAEFLVAAQRSPTLRDRLYTAIEGDALLQGAALLHVANDDKVSAELHPQLIKFVDAIESGDPDQQGLALDGLDNRLYRALSNSGFGDEWISARMTGED